jgi:aspartyl-tRNA(Asn)/glutamyl-tRNA(Gln) amidotransferase subunit B
MEIIELAAILNESDSGFDALKITSQNLADICTMISDGDVSRNQAKTLLAELANHGGEAKSLADKMGLKQVSDTSALEAIIDSVFEEFAQDVASYSDADEGKQKKLQGFLMGKAMAASKGQGNPQLFNQIISKKLG